MLWSLAKALLFFAMLAMLTWGAAILSATDGGVRIALLGKELTLGPLQALIAVVLLFIALWIVLRLAGFVIAVLRFFLGDDTALSRHFHGNRERRGFKALSEAMLALASGEHRVALSRAAKAERLLGRPELTKLITAEAALALGDTARAEEAYRDLLKEDDSRFIGIRGLTRMKLAEGDKATALKLTHKALELKPRHAETRDLLLKLQTGEGDWQGARATLGAKRKAGDLPKDVWKRRDAVLALQEAKVLLDENASIEAQEAAIAANKASPDLIPAAAMAARSYAAAGNARAATRVLKKAWEAQPHPDLAAAFAEIAPEETPQQRIERFRTLTDQTPDHSEARMLLAELKIAAEDFPGARRALGDLIATAPTARALTIMAAIERGTGADDAVVRGWMARALTAPRGPQWICENCNAIHAHWAPSCENCAGFDTLTWKAAPEQTGPSATQTEMLPLLVGRPAEAAPPPEAPLAPASAPRKEAPAAPEPVAEETEITAEPAPFAPPTPEELARRGAF